ncbi:hypothetical protein CRD60_00755 [Bifidobacterium aemilianum]|uniref:Uncharacterized protein n=1 Tax=Bifidobacterium aemilianum TaxID=2493120 RepID=A0A366KCP3_9BIFI|nr:hypothetical protein [Bifidobacterium aemilianum]RBP98431.1 hypothetical protein CRD60_00755 [Bifidobacterium aemilianum]
MLSQSDFTDPPDSTWGKKDMGQKPIPDQLSVQEPELSLPSQQPAGPSPAGREAFWCSDMNPSHETATASDDESKGESDEFDEYDGERQPTYELYRVIGTVRRHSRLKRLISLFCLLVVLACLAYVLMLRRIPRWLFGPRERKMVLLIDGFGLEGMAKGMGYYIHVRADPDKAEAVRPALRNYARSVLRSLHDYGLPQARVTVHIDDWDPTTLMEEAGSLSKLKFGFLPT